MTSTMYISSHKVSESADGGHRTCGYHHGFFLWVIDAVHATVNMCMQMQTINVKIAQTSCESWKICACATLP